MSKEWPKFKLFAVVSGKNRGLLAEKQRDLNSLPEKVYFYLEGDLKPTEQILKWCNYNDKCLYAGDYREERIFNEFVSCAITVATTGKKSPFEFTQKYPEKRGYQEVVDRYYDDNRQSPFKDFFESAAILKKHVLKNVHGKLYLAEPRAEGFSMVSPHSIVADDFQYLRPIKEVLRIDSNDSPKWFRKSGPIAADFNNDRVYWRKKLLKELKSSLLSNCFLILEGIAATGKTVLVRQLSYELYDRDKWSVYYFDCDIERDFDLNEVVREINSTSGVFIVENIHLETEKFQRVYSKVKQIKHKHILFTTRPSFRENSRITDRDLTQIKSIHLKPFDDVDEIIEHFASHHPLLPWSTEVRQRIKENSAKSFWLLSYALGGFLSTHGQGEPKEWIGKSVEKDLQELERICPTFPEVLISISPLYQREVLTEESFLREVLGFEQKTLNELVQRGEITRQKIFYPYLLYGLPHSALAEVYWEYGQVYRRRRMLPAYEDFICRYAVSEVPNGLEAVTKQKGTNRERLLSRLREKNNLTSVVRRSSLRSILDWLMVIDIKTNVNEQLLEILGEKIESATDFLSAGRCFRAVYESDNRVGTKLWQAVDKTKLGNNLIRVKDTRSAVLFVLNVLVCNEELTWEIFTEVNSQELATRIKETDVTADMIDRFACVNISNSKVGEEVCRFLADEIFSVKRGRKRSEWVDPDGFIARILEMDENRDSPLHKSSDVKAVARRLNSLMDYTSYLVFFWCTIDEIPEAAVLTAWSEKKAQKIRKQLGIKNVLGLDDSI